MTCLAQQAELGISRRTRSTRTPHVAFLAVAGLVFAASVAVTIAWCTSMSAMGMPMPGGWTMSMAWMRMPGQTWLDAGASFLGMWIVMMVAMMLPSIVPALWRYREAVRRSGATRTDLPTALAGLGYFFVWTVFGIAAFPVGIALAAVEMQQPLVARAVPFVVGVAVLAAGALQFGAWKARHLACWEEAPASVRGKGRAAAARLAWQFGIDLGLRCGRCSGNLMAILLVAGVMNVWLMAAVTTAITAERLAPRGERVARAVGVVVVASGLILVARAAGVG